MKCETSRNYLSNWLKTKKIIFSWLGSYRRRRASFAHTAWRGNKSNSNENVQLEHFLSRNDSTAHVLCRHDARRTWLLSSEWRIPGMARVSNNWKLILTGWFRWGSDLQFNTGWRGFIWFGLRTSKIAWSLHRSLCLQPVDRTDACMAREQTSTDTTTERRIKHFPQCHSNSITVHYMPCPSLLMRPNSVLFFWSPIVINNHHFV